MNRIQRGFAASATTMVVAVAGMAGTGAVATASPPAAGAQRIPVARTDGGPTTGERAALRAGIQVGPKHTRRPRVRVGGRSYPAANPFLAQLASGAGPDWSYWRRRTAVQGLRLAAARTAHPRPVPTPLVHAEAEPVGSYGLNDTWAAPERLVDVGIGRPYQAVQVRGRLSTSAVTAKRLATREDQGAIGRATTTRIGPGRRAARVRSWIGDGAHASGTGGTGDFDFFRVRVAEGQTLTATTLGSRFDTVLALYGPAGRLLASNDDDDETSGVTSALSYDAGTPGYRYVMVGGFSQSGSLPSNPFRTGSGSGAGEEGRYRLDIASRPVDKDYYGIRLDSGDVLSGTLTGGAGVVGVHGVTGQQLVTSSEDLSAVYPASTPLTGGGASFAYVAEEPGWYAVSVTRGAGGYRLLGETYRPGSEQAGEGAVQTVFLDFDGARLNTGIFGGWGVSTLSPARSFLPAWGLSAADETAVTEAVVATVRENVEQTVAARGLNPDLRVRVLDSLHDADPWGRPDVSRVIVGGTIHESGVPTIGTAQSVDPGNFAGEETALVLLDLLSERAGEDYSFNSYLTPASDRVAFVGRALGNAVSHEAGHLIGSFHTDNRSARTDLMDEGGDGYAALFGVGRDGVGGTPDDTDVNFGEDAFSPVEGLTGTEDTLNNSAWAFLPGTAGP